MCGIVGYIGKRDVAPLLLEGLQRLEYRGYDSAGVVITSPKATGLKMVKAKGRVRDLEARVPKRFTGTTGIAHTRWATHGAPSDENAHPHLDGENKVAVVHNGIIDNASELRAKLIADGVEFRSETDTEVLTHLIARSTAEKLEDRVREALRHILLRIQQSDSAATATDRQADEETYSGGNSHCVPGIFPDIVVSNVGVFFGSFHQSLFSIRQRLLTFGQALLDFLPRHSDLLPRLGRRGPQ